MFGLSNLGLLQKLTISAFNELSGAETGNQVKAKSPTESTDSMFVAFYNPETVSSTYGVSYNANMAIGDTNIDGAFEKYTPATFSFELLFDGTGASLPQGVMITDVQSTDYVSKQITKLKTVAYYYVGDKHRPRFLKLSWGNTYLESCVLTSMTVTYSLFHANGDPLRAKVKCEFKEVASNDLRRSSQNQKSPDITHVRVIKQGDRLPLLCEEIYGAADLYLEVAKFNGLRNHRNLVAGQKIYFPPLVAAKA